jgi:hypothetical protein
MNNKDFWKVLSIHQQLSPQFIIDFKNDLYWNLLCSSQKFDHSILDIVISEPYKLLIDWKDYCIYQKLDENTINIFQNNDIPLSWNMISIHQDLSEEFILKYSHKLNWNYISEYQILSENFIKINSDLVNWEKICKYQKISFQTLKYWIQNDDYILSKINVEILKYSQDYTEDQKNEMIDMILNLLHEKIKTLNLL